MVWVKISRQVLDHHVVVLHIDESFVVFEEVAEGAVVDGQCRVPSWINTDTTWEVVQVEKYCVTLVEHLLIRIHLEELLMVWEARFRPETSKYGVRFTLGLLLVYEV